jgi:hypothetical protein
MRSSRVVRASGCQCQSHNNPGFDPSIKLIKNHLLDPPGREPGTGGDSTLREAPEGAGDTHRLPEQEQVLYNFMHRSVPLCTLQFAVDF